MSPELSDHRTVYDWTCSDLTDQFDIIQDNPRSRSTAEGALFLHQIDPVEKRQVSFLQDRGTLYKSEITWQCYNGAVLACMYLIFG